MRLEVYTALFGPLAPTTLASPPSGADRYRCVTDNPSLDAGPEWTVIQVPPSHDPRAAARSIKLHPETICPKADVSIWMDGSFTFLEPPTVIADAARATGAPIVAFKHPDRNRITDEADVLLKYHLYDHNAVRAQIEHYRSRGFDTDEHPQPHLTTTGLLVRQHTPEVEAFNDLWYTQLQGFTWRDQLSVDYCAQQLGVRIGYLEGHYRKNPYVLYHRNRRIPKTPNHVPQ